MELQEENGVEKKPEAGVFKRVMRAIFIDNWALKVSALVLGFAAWFLASLL